MMYSGIDLHKRTVAIHTVDAAGTLIRKADLPTNRAAVTAYFATLDGPHQAVCECTRVYQYVVLDAGPARAARVLICVSRMRSI